MAVKYPKVERGSSVPPMQLTRKVTIDVERALPGYYDSRGRWVEGTRSTIKVEANVQPAKGHELWILPESDRTDDWIKIYSVETLQTLYEGEGGVEADIVLWNDKRYQVKITQTYQMGVLNHTKSLAVRLPVINGDADA